MPAISGVVGYVPWRESLSAAAGLVTEFVAEHLEFLFSKLGEGCDVLSQVEFSVREAVDLVVVPAKFPGGCPDARVHALAPLLVVGPPETGGFATQLLAEPFDSGFALVNLELPVGLNLKTVL